MNLLPPFSRLQRPVQQAVDADPVIIVSGL
jgi:hypothetical protein